MYLRLFTALVLATQFVTVSSSPTKLPLPVRQVYGFPLYTWIENIAVRSNGNLLVTLVDKPELHSLDASAAKPQPSLVHTFEGVTSIFGITEIEPDVFVVSAGNSTLGTPAPRSFSVWKVDFRNSLYPPFTPGVIKITNIPEAIFLNGVATLSRSAVLIADSILGAIWQVDISTGAYSIASNITEFHAPPGRSFGVNGIHIFDEYLYWTNSQALTLYKAKLDRGGKQLLSSSSVQTVSHTDERFLDDFALDWKGNAWVATNVGNSIIVVAPNGKSLTVAGAVGELTVAGSTGAAFGRTAKDHSILYVTTNGAVAAPVNGAFEGGKIVAIDTARFFSSNF